MITVTKELPKEIQYTGCVRKNYTILYVICKEISTLQPLKNSTTVKYIYAAVINFVSLKLNI